MICEILHPIFDALGDEFRFHGLGLQWELRIGQESMTAGRLSLLRFFDVKMLN